ncbi:hypothetical protein EPN44_11915 [bacterium]|nr:MAG: hypothetical protein EPN44_11915 [bacterium]
MRAFVSVVGLALATSLAACGGGGAPSSAAAPAASTSPGSSAPTTNPAFILPTGFVSSTIANVPSARELAALPNGDLLVGTTSAQVYLVPNAEGAGAAGTPHVFITLPSGEGPANGVAISPDGSTIYVATEYHVYRTAYHSGDQTEPDASAQPIAAIRTGGIPANSDGDVHVTSSLAVGATTVYVGVGSSCNACTEVDPTRATIQAMGLAGTGMHTIARRIRNPIALAVNPSSGVLWAGGAGQDNLPYGHPYESVDAVTLQSGSPVDYGWPECEENRVAYVSSSNCASVAVPRVEFPAYATHIGAAFYPSNPTGAYAFPAQYRGGLFVASHGSWHCCPATSPGVAFVPMNGDTPRTPVDWSNPSAQWQPFLSGFGGSVNTSYLGRPTGIAVGAKGSLFVADDHNGVIYRVRPG